MEMKQTKMWCHVKIKHQFNPLAPGLNAWCNMHRLEFKSDDLVFSCVQYEKKQLLEFSFLFDEIYLSSLFMK